MNGLSSVTPSMSSNRTLFAPDARLAAKARQGDARGLALEAARTLVSEGLVKPMFAELREGNMAGEMFKPGVAERRFRPILDGMLADRVVASKDFPVVEVVADRFEKSIRARSGAVSADAYTATGAKP
jgi:hypothetical protein